MKNGGGGNGGKVTEGAVVEVAPVAVVVLFVDVVVELTPEKIDLYTQGSYTKYRARK